MVSKKKIRKEKREKPTRIVVERVYLGGQSREDAFRKINEETVKENITEIFNKHIEISNNAVEKSKENIEKIYDLAEVYHSENIEKVSDEIIEKFKIVNKYE